MYFGLSNLPFLAAAAILPFQLALLEWYRKSEFSSDRAGLLAVQDLNTVMSTEMKLAGGKAYGDTLRVEEFIRQAEQYETGGDAWDTVYKILNTVMRTHPMHTVRAAELLRWHARAATTRSSPATTCRRGQGDQDQPLREDYADAAGYYGQKTRETVDTFKDELQQGQGRGQLGVAQSMKVLIVGGGGREHALAWRLRQEDPTLEFSPRPGNPGHRASSRRASRRRDRRRRARRLARRREAVDWTLVGPEAPLAAGHRRRVSRRRTADLRPDARRRDARDVEGVREGDHGRRRRADGARASPARRSPTRDGAIDAVRRAAS